MIRLYDNGVLNLIASRITPSELTFVAWRMSNGRVYLHRKTKRARTDFNRVKWLNDRGFLRNVLKLGYIIHKDVKINTIRLSLNPSLRNGVSGLSQISQQIKSVYLEECHLSNDDFNTISEMFSTSKSIKTLALPGNNMTNTKASYIAKLIAKSKSLVYLMCFDYHFEGNDEVSDSDKIDQRGFEMIVASLVENVSLRGLGLGSRFGVRLATLDTFWIGIFANAMAENVNSGLTRIYIDGYRIGKQHPRVLRLITGDEKNLDNILEINRFYTRKHISIMSEKKLIPFSCLKMKSLNSLYYYVKSNPLEVCQNRSCIKKK